MSLQYSSRTPKCSKRDISFEDFLKKLGLSEDEYIKTVQISVKTEKNCSETQTYRK